MSSLPQPARAGQLRGSDRRGQPVTAGERGAALIITLLLMGLLAALSLIMFIWAYSGTLINGYYRNFRGSFYAADSGANIARQYMANHILAAAPTNYAPGNPPLPVGLDSTIQASALSTYSQPTSLNSGQAANSWRESFYVQSVGLQLAPSSPTVTAVDPSTGKATGYQYIYNYTVVSVGRSQGSEQAKVQDTGQITFNTALTPSGPSRTSFAAWGAFIDQYAPCSGFLVPGLFSGPTFTNGEWNFGPPAYGQYIFTDPIGSASPDASFWFNQGGWTCIRATTGSDTYSGQTIAPQYQAGYQWGQQPVPLPTNAYSQERAVLDGKGSDTSPVTNAELNASLRDINGNPYPLAGAPSGVYLPYKVNPGTGALTFTGGGFYVQGNASIQLAATTDATGNPTETYTITQGSTITTLTVNNTTNTTLFSSGGINQVISGVPQQFDPSSGVPKGPATMLYVSNSVTGLTGPYDANGNSLPAIQDGTALTITSPGNITVTGDVVYKTEPVTTTQNQIPGPPTPPDTLIPGNNKGQVLGIFTLNGNINLDIDTIPNTTGNIQVDGSLATISQGGTGGFFNTGNTCINTFNNIGGQIQNDIYGACMNTENTYFDRRFSSGFGPPWFPSTTISSPGSSVANYTQSVQRVQWVDLSHM